MEEVVDLYSEGAFHFGTIAEGSGLHLRVRCTEGLDTLTLLKSLNPLFSSVNETYET